MSKYVIRFDPEYFATSLWTVSDSARDEFGCDIAYEKLPLSKQLVERLEKFDDKVMDIIDWSEPNGDSPMTIEERRALYREGQELMVAVIDELGSDFEVIDCLDWINPDKQDTSSRS